MPQNGPRHEEASREPSTVEAPLDESSPADPSPDEGGQPSSQPTTPDSGKTAGVAEEGEANIDEHNGSVAETDLAYEKLLLLLPQAPLIVDLALFIDGKPYQHAMQQVVEKVVAWADTDADGKATWEEVSESPRFIYGQLGNAPVNNEEERKRLISLYDTNRNSLVDIEEVPRFITRNAGRGRGFVLRSDSRYRGFNRYESKLRLIMDKNNDGLLSRDELKHAPEVINRFDADDDGVLYASDFESDASGPGPGMMRSSRPEAAFLISPHLDWSRVDYALRDTYANGNRLRADNIQFSPECFLQLDTDGNGSLSSKELKQLSVIEADVKLIVRFGSNTIDSKDREGTVSPSVQVKWFEKSRFSLHAIDDSGAQARLQYGDVFMDIFANDRINTEMAEAGKVRLAALDADANGYLDEDEAIAGGLTQRYSFAAYDTNSDEKIYPDELQEFIDSQQVAMHSQIWARLFDVKDAVFISLDENHDGWLTPRETANVADVLHAWDKDGDGEVSHKEIPLTIELAFARGDMVNNRDGLFTKAPTPGDRLINTPDWFSAMDLNADGDIDRREFLGVEVQFNDLDNDSDGFISGAEVTGQAQDKSGDGV